MNLGILAFFSFSFEYTINDIDEKAKVRKDTQHYYSGTYSYDQRISHELVIYPIEVVFKVIYAV